MERPRFHSTGTIAISVVLVVLGVALVVVGVLQPAPVKAGLGVLVGAGGVARIMIERRRRGR